MTGTAWERLGLVFRAEGQRPWMRTHSQMPHAERIEGSVFRVYFTCRDERNRSHIAWLAVDLERPSEILELASEPLMGPGRVGRFDDVGIMSSCMVETGGERRFYVIGWNIRTTVRMHVSVGLATGPAAGPPRIGRLLAGPVLDRNPANPYYATCPWVARDDDGGWRMWYASGLDWADGADGRPATRYNIWHARSPDGVVWTPDREATLDFAHPREVAVTRPLIVRDPGVWRMWQCWRGEDYDYRIGYAESDDGVRWTRRDDDPMALLASGSGFDSEAASYPFVFDHGGERWMLYSGDAYGQAGFGLARLRTSHG